MKILDEKKFLRHTAETAIQEPEREHCFLAIAQQIEKDTYRLSDFCNAEDLGGVGEEYHFRIPAKTGMALLNICQREKKIPVVVHTHPYLGEDAPNVRFSNGDVSYMDRFTECAAEKNISCCLFIVTNGISLMYCRRTLQNMLYTFEEGKVSELA